MIEIKTRQDFDDLLTQSFKRPVLLCKFSPICGNTPVARDEIEIFLKSTDKILPYSIDVVHNRDLARAIAKEINIKHESPQVLLFVNGKCLFDEDHYHITDDSLRNGILPLINN